MQSYRGAPSGVIRARRVGNRVAVALLLCLCMHAGGMVRADSLSVGRDFVQCVAETKKSIAYIEVLTDHPPIASCGTAFLVHDLGLMVTCRHTLFDTLQYKGTQAIPDTSRIRVRFHLSGEWFNARLLADRQDKDIALIAVPLNDSIVKAQGLKSTVLGKSTDLTEGIEVGCVGYDLNQKTSRFGKDYYWLTTHKGIVSNVFWVGPNRDSEFIDAFQIDATVNKGASGAPVFLARTGDVVGMVNRLRGVMVGEMVINYGIADCVSSAYLAGVVLNWAQDELQRLRK